MFHKIMFKSQLEILLDGGTTTDFSEKTGFNRTYISKYLNLKLDRPPSPTLLKSISNSLVSYEELMVSCGYLNNDNAPSNEYIKVPVIKTIHSNKPMFQKENIEYYEYLSNVLLSPSGEYFYLRVNDNQMKNARIFENDMVFIQKQSYAKTGDIAAIIIDDSDVALYRTTKKENMIILQQENTSCDLHIFLDSEISRLQFIGKVLHVKFMV